MLEARFGLRRRPFPATPDPACYYPATSHELCLGMLLDGLGDGEGVLLLTGGPGLGKTLLCHCLLERLAERLGQEHDPIFVTHGACRDRVALLQTLLFDLSLPHEGKSEQELRLALIDHLLSRFGNRRKTVLILDEAHLLGPDLLEELRLLANLEGSSGRAVQVLLVAQPMIMQALSNPVLASLRQRLAVRATLEPMGVEEAADYLLHHIRAAGGAEGLLDAEGLELLASHTAGIPRLLNQACNQALRLAAEMGNTCVDAEVALEALAKLGLVRDEEPGKDMGGDEGDNYRLFMAPGRSA